jgi:hypothetical protein
MECPNLLDEPQMIFEHFKGGFMGLPKLWYAPNSFFWPPEIHSNFKYQKGRQWAPDMPPIRVKKASSLKSARAKKRLVQKAPTLRSALF